MRICPRYPGTRAGSEGLREKADEFVWVDVLGECMRAGLDEAEDLLCRYDCEEV